MRIYAELDFGVVADTTFPLTTVTAAAQLVDKPVSAGMHFGYVEVEGITTSEHKEYAPNLRMTVRGWTRLPCPGESMRIIFNVGKGPGGLEVTPVPASTWERVLEGAPCDRTPDSRTVQEVAEIREVKTDRK
jgi:hypothetical protein